MWMAPRPISLGAPSSPSSAQHTNQRIDPSGNRFLPPNPSYTRPLAMPRLSLGWGGTEGSSTQTVSSPFLKATSDELETQKDKCYFSRLELALPQPSARWGVAPLGKFPRGGYRERFQDCQQGGQAEGTLPYPNTCPSQIFFSRHHSPISGIHKPVLTPRLMKLPHAVKD